MKLIFFLVLLVAQLSFAIDVQFNRFTQNSSYETLENAILENPYTKVRNRWGFTAGYSFVEHPLARGIKRTLLFPVLSHLHSLQLGFNLALAKRLELMINSSVHHARFNLNKKSYTVMGDSNLLLKYQFLKRKNWAMAIRSHVTIPTGDEGKFLGKEEFGYGAIMSLERVFRFFGTVINLGYSYNQNNILKNINYEHLYHFGIGLRVPFNRWALQAEWRINFTNENTEQRPNEFHLGASYQISRPLRLFTSLGIGDYEFKNNSEVRAVLGLKGSYGSLEKKPVIEKPVYFPSIGNVYFRFALYKVDPPFYKSLNNLVKIVLRHHRHIKAVEISGHTDGIGREPSNYKLSVNRARAVIDYLVSRGAPRSLFTYKGYGTTRPAVKPEKNSVDRALNRRAIIKIIPKKQQINK